MKSLEEYANEVVTNSNGSASEMPSFVSENIQRSIQSSLDYHTKTADVLHKEGEDSVIARYHEAMANIYRALKTP